MNTITIVIDFYKFFIFCDRFNPTVICKIDLKNILEVLT